MEDLVLNETPVRTSRNFNINNIKLKNVYVPSKLEEFKTVNIKNDSSKIKIDSFVDDYNVTYGISEKFNNMALKEANSKIRIVADSLVNKEIILDFCFDEQNKNLAGSVEIIAKENSRVTVIIKYTSNDKNYFNNSIIKTIAGESSIVNIVIVNLLGKKSNNFITLDSNVQDSAKVNYTIVDFGGETTVTSLYSNLIGKASQTEVNAIYLGNENQIFDLNYIGHLRGENSNIDIDVQGALKDNAKKNFKGTIDFKKGCKKAKGNENENCILLSDTAKSLALPMLLCSEEDVEGNHSSSAGKVGEKELFYIMSRGFDIKEAMKLMVRARFNKILETIKNEEIKQLVLEEIDKKLD